jgi:diketogulonate reductase-like aldo/keto reductase
MKKPECIGHEAAFAAELCDCQPALFDQDEHEILIPISGDVANSSSCCLALLLASIIIKFASLEACEELGIGFVPWGPVGQGYLTEKIDTRTKFDPTMDMRSAFPRFLPENIAANMPIVEFLGQFAKKKNATPAQISLAWLLAQNPWIVPIPGTRGMEHLTENLGAIHVQLTAPDLLEIDTALSEIKVHGGRMNEEQMKVVDQTV